MNTAAQKQPRITLLSGHHLTATQRKIISTLLARKMYSGGTKLIQMNIKPEKEPNTYIVEIHERYAMASRNFDTRAESKIVKWHYEQTVKVKAV